MPFFKVQIRRVRFWWNLTLAYLKRYRLWLLSIIILITSLVQLTTKIWPHSFGKNLVTIGYVGAYTLQTIPTEVLSLATQSLISHDENGRPVGSLASGWTVSDDGKTYIIFLRDNLKWHDDSNVEAKDISIAISGVKITALNNKAIELKLPNPISSFPLVLDKPVFKSKSFYGTGNFRIIDIKKVGDEVKKISLVPKDKNLPRVEIKFYPEESQAINALKIGEIKSLLANNSKGLENWPNLDISKKEDRSQVITIFFNNQDQELSSKELRQALNYAINKTEFNGLAASGPIPQNSWAYNTSVKRYEYNPGRAKELLAKSGIEKPRINLTVTAGLDEQAQKIKGDWQAIGIETIITSTKSIPKDFQALLAINKLNPDPDQYALWHSTQNASNISHYKDVKVDKLLEDARSEKIEDNRKQLYFDFQKFLMENAPVAFLYYPYKYQITYKNAKTLLERLPKNQEP